MIKNILVIRRDNIGDLVCTTPLISNLHKAYPDANIDVLVNSYNAPVVENNPEIDNVYVYKKAKHCAPGESKIKTYLDRFKTYFEMRRKGIDVAILAGAGYNRRALRVAKLVGARRVIGYAKSGQNDDGAITDVVPYENIKGNHEVELINRLAEPLGINIQPPASTLKPSAEELERVKAFLRSQGLDENTSPIGLHISARKPSNRWTEANYIQLILRIWETYQRPVMLFWSPGSKDNILHPGDDELAESIREKCSSVPLLPFPTQKLAELIAGVSVCKPFICSDGGAMHIAAATQCPILCFFGNSEAWKWYPWGTPHRLIQKPSLEVADISVDEAFGQLQSLITEIEQPGFNE